MLGNVDQVEKYYVTFGKTTKIDTKTTMSRIGKKEILIPENIKFEIINNKIVIEGNKGKLNYSIPTTISIEKTNTTIKLRNKENTKKSQQLYGLSRSIINNMIIGVSKGFEKRLIIHGVGYRSQMDGQTLILNVGYSHIVKIKPPENIKISVENNVNIIVSGINKEIVGQVASTIRLIRPPEPYKGKGIRYENENIKRKIGKAGK